MYVYAKHVASLYKGSLLSFISSSHNICRKPRQEPAKELLTELQGEIGAIPAGHYHHRLWSSILWAQKLGFCENIIWSSVAFNADSASIRMKGVVVLQQQNISASNIPQEDWLSVHHSMYFTNSRLTKYCCQKYWAIHAAPQSPLEHHNWDKCWQPRMRIWKDSTPDETQECVVKVSNKQQFTLLWPIKNLLYKTHWKSQSTFVAIYGHNCLYTENMLFSSFSVIWDLAPAPAVKVL